MQKVVFVDVDDTLVRSYGFKRIPMSSVVDSVRRLKVQGYQLFLWSSGGADYCKKSAEELGIADCFEGFLPKPNYYIDDQPVHDWKLCTHIYPLQADQALTDV